MKMETSLIGSFGIMQREFKEECYSYKGLHLKKQTSKNLVVHTEVFAKGNKLNSKLEDGSKH